MSTATETNPGVKLPDQAIIDCTPVGTYPRFLHLLLDLTR